MPTSSINNAQRAWEKFLDAVTNYGYYHSVDFNDPKIVLIINLLGGWLHICSSLTESRVEFYREKFIRLYFDLPDNITGPTHVVGFIDSQVQKIPKNKNMPKPISEIILTWRKTVKMGPNLYSGFNNDNSFIKKNKIKNKGNFVGANKKS